MTFDPNVIGAIGSGIGGLLGFAGQSSANRTNRAIAEANIEFQREMSNSAYQRAMADMRAAGLNPILAYKQGGAGTPQGAVTTVGNALGAGINSALAVNEAYQRTRKTTSDIDKIRSEISKLREETDLVSWQRFLTESNVILTDVQIAIANNEQDRVRAQITKLYKEIELYEEELKIKRNLGEIDEEEWGKQLRVINRFVETFSPFIKRR
ncbi:putative minor capsid protein [Eel River basin pequenovirus]|nr:putative minor capsid protein [Eel River basin pequenovirus]